MKHKVVRSEGCMASGRVFVDGVDEYDMSPEAKAAFLKKLCWRIRKELSLNHLNLARVVELFVPIETKYSDTCEQCGDTIVTETWEI